MTQERALVSCPYCPATLPVVAPDMNKRIQSVQANKFWFTTCGARVNPVACPACDRRFWLSWTYQRPDFHLRIIDAPIMHQLPHHLLPPAGRPKEHSGIKPQLLHDRRQTS